MPRPRVILPQVRAGSGLRRSLLPAWSLFAGRHPAPTHRFDKNAPRERSLPAPKEPRFEIRVPGDAHARPTSGRRQCRGPTVADPHKAHTTLHAPAGPVRAMAIWWQAQGSPLLRPLRWSEALEGPASRNHTLRLDPRDEVDQGSRPEGESDRLLARNGRAHLLPRSHHLDRPTGGARPSMPVVPVRRDPSRTTRRSHRHRGRIERSSVLKPFHKICTPMHTRMNDDSRMTTFIAASPSTSPILSAKR
jgi:hypothetical protein